MGGTVTARKITKTPETDKIVMQQASKRRNKRTEGKSLDEIYSGVTFERQDRIAIFRYRADQIFEANKRKAETNRRLTRKK